MKTAYDMKHVKGTTAVALMKDGELAGKIVANWSDNPNGSVCTATVQLFAYGEQRSAMHGTGRATGYGYDKLSSAIYEALRGMWESYWNTDHDCAAGRTVNLTDAIPVRPGSGNQRQAFEAAGYQYVEVC